MKRIGRALAPGLDRTMTPGIAAALAARVVFLVGTEALTEEEVVVVLLNPLFAGKVLDAALLSDRVNNLAAIAKFHLEDGREEVA